jgi:VWFA-related protein
VRSLKLFTLIGILTLLGIAPVATTLPLQQGPDASPFTIAVDADLVVFNLTVTDSQGRHVAGLKAGDFEVREDGRVQNINHFNAEDGPASIGLIIDNSGSMRQKHTDVTKAALAFASASNLEDEMFVITFNEKATLELPLSKRFDNDLDQIHSALERKAPNGMTALYDALALGIGHLKSGTLQHKALVVLSDGGDNASRISLNTVLQLAQRSSATMYAIGIYDKTDLDRNPRVLRRIAESSGGRAYFPEFLRDMERIWRDIAHEIRSEYTIGYQSSNPNRDGKFRSVRVTAKRGGERGLNVATRDGYFAAEPN